MIELILDIWFQEEHGFKDVENILVIKENF